VQADLSIGAPEAPQVMTSADELAPDWSTELDDLGDDLNAPHVDEAVVRGLLAVIGGGLCTFVGDPDIEDHWTFSQREIDDLAPPLTRIINRRPKLRAAVARGDEAAVAIVLAGYGGRHVAAGAAARRARKEHDGHEHREAEPGEGSASAPPAGARLWRDVGEDGGTADGVRPATD